MKTELLHSPSSTLEACAQWADNGVREASAHSVQDHCPDIRKMVDLGSGGHRDIDGKPLTSQFVISDLAFNSPEFEGIGMDGLPCSSRLSNMADSPYLKSLH